MEIVQAQELNGISNIMLDSRQKLGFLHAENDIDEAVFTLRRVK